jgi:hypothetical protein
MSPNQRMEANVDVSRNVLRTLYAGRLSKLDMESAMTTVKSAMERLQPGFTILADWSHIEAIELDCVPCIAEIMEFARERGAALIVRVLPEPEKDIGINILSIVHLRGTARTVTADNLEEAERLIL